MIIGESGDEGKRPFVFPYQSDTILSMYIGLDIGGTKTAVLLTNSTQEPLLQTQQPTDKENLVPSLVQIIQKSVEEADKNLATLSGIGLGIPGIVNSTKGDVTMAVNLGVLEPLPLAGQLSSALQVPVMMENDVRLAALGLREKHQLNNLIYLNVGTGVAAGIVINGRLFRGSSMGAGEVGHIPLHTTQRPLEHSIAGPGIMRQATELGLTIRHPGELYALAHQGEQTAQQLVATISDQISQTILWLIMSFDVDALFLGGGITQIGEPFMIPVLRSLATARSYSKLAELTVTDDKIRLVPADFNAGLWGAIQLAHQASIKRVS